MPYKGWIIIAIFLFAIGIALGLATPAGIADLLSEDLRALEELGGMLAPFSIATAIFIFVKNALAIVMSFTLSPIFCLVPILALTINGWLLGFVSPALVSNKSLGFLLAGLLPHGIFEIPALILGEAAALSFGAMVTVALFKKEKRQLLLPSLKQNLRYIVVALILLVPAAIIETFLTPLLLGQ
jgi:stage II sporulation protein M